MNGPDPIQPTELLAWLTLHNETLEPWEATLLERMDITLLEGVTKNGD